MQAQWADGHHELPSVPLPARFGEILQVGIVQYPDAHSHDAHLVDGVGHLLVLARHHVVACVRAYHGDAALVEQGQTGGLAGRGAGAGYVPRALDLSPVQLAGAHQQDVTLFHAKAAASLRLQDVFRHGTLAPVQPVDATHHGHVHQHGACGDAVFCHLHRLHGSPQAGGN